MARMPPFLTFRKSDSRGLADCMVPGFEHGIGLMGDEWRIGMNDGPFPYCTNPDHRCRENEVLIRAMRYAYPEEAIGFRYENPIVIRPGPLPDLPSMARTTLGAGELGGKRWDYGILSGSGGGTEPE